MLRPFDRPIDTLVSVTFVAGVGDAELFGEQWVWGKKGVIAARVDLHVSGFRHVAIHTHITRAAFAVEAVGNGFDDWRILNPARVATHAKQVVLNR